MNGPPTPPAEPVSLPSPTSIAPTESAPTTADAPVPQTHTAPPPEETSPSPYIAFFADICAAASQQNYEEVVRLAELADLTSTHNQDESRFLITAPLVLAYLIIDDLPPAGYALTRLPDKLKNHRLASDLFALLASTWEKRHANVYARAEALYNFAKGPELQVAGLSATLASLTESFVEAFRTRTLKLIAKAYSSITLSLAQSYLGLTQDPLLAAAQSHGWMYDHATQILTPTQAPAYSQASGISSGHSTLHTLEKITDNAAALGA